ncbi:MAG: sigma-70 family RNA polymerase sigma factor [Acidobacteria bacterium]|nr:sigma-70 family RNA polymerase sigma factor [Acidobacteriota bacterium]
MAENSLGFRNEGGEPAAQVYKDALLVERLRQGEDEAFEELLRTYEDPVYNLVYRLLNQPVDAPDVVQEIFVKVYRNLGHFQGKSTLKTWIYRIAVNEAYNHRRWFSRHKKNEVGISASDENHLGLSDVLPDRCRSPFDLTADHETRALIEEALLKINPVFRSAVVLRDIEDMNYDEIAEVLQISLGTVKSRIMRGREALRVELEAMLKPAQAFGWSAQAVTGQS